MSTISAEQFRERYGQSSIDKFNSKKLKKPGYLERLKEGYKSGAERLTSGIAEGAEQMESGNVLRGGLTGALRTTGAVAETALMPIIEAPGVKEGLETVGKGISKLPGVDYLIKKANEFAKSNPTLAKDIQDVLDIVGLFGAQATEKAVTTGVKKGVTKLTTGIKGLSDDIVPKVKKLIPSKSKTISSVTDKIDDIDDIAEAIRPLSTGTQLKTEAAKGLAKRTGALKKVVTETPKEYTKIAKNLKGVINSKDPIKNMDSLIKYSDDLVKKVGDEFAKSDKIFNTKTLKKYLLDKIDDVDILEIDPKTLGQFKTRLVDDMLKQIKTNKASKLWEARKSMDKILEERLNIFSGSPSTKKTMGLKLRGAVNDFIGDTYKGYKPLMKQMSEVYKVTPNIADKIAKLYGKDVLDTWIAKLSKIPVVRAVGGTTKRFLGR